MVLQPLTAQWHPLLTGVQHLQPMGAAAGIGPERGGVAAAVAVKHGAAAPSTAELAVGSFYGGWVRHAEAGQEAAQT